MSVRARRSILEIDEVFIALPPSLSFTRGVRIPVGERAPRDPEILAAQQRQVNSCSIALAVKEKVRGPEPEPVDSGVKEAGAADAARD